VTIWGAVAGGVVGTVVLTSGLRAAQELGITRMDLPLLLGTAFAAGRDRAIALGYGLHFVNGVLFSLCYYAVFAATGHAGWLFGAGLGLAHALFAGTGLVSALLPLVHPRMGRRWTDATTTPLLEPPGWMMRNYGARTMAVMIVLHLAYGAIVGGFAAQLG
jgi:hypothetical protein